MLLSWVTAMTSLKSLSLFYLMLDVFFPSCCPYWAIFNTAYAVIIVNLMVFLRLPSDWCTFYVYLILCTNQSANCPFYHAFLLCAIMCCSTFQFQLKCPISRYPLNPRFSVWYVEIIFSLDIFLFAE